MSTAGQALRGSKPMGNGPGSYNGVEPPCTGCISINNCKRGMACNYYVSWTKVGDKATGDRIPMRRLMGG